MKMKTLRTGAALACALVLSACGGGDDVFPDVPMQVNLANVTQAGLTLKLNGGAPVAVAPGTIFVFPDRVPANSLYKVELGGSLPANAISCSVINGEASVGISVPTNIVATCVLYTYKLGGTITGTLPAEVVINNGSGSVTVPAGATSFALPPVPEGAPYSVTILRQPAGATCSVTPGNATIAAPVGIMPKAEIANLNVDCRLNPPA